MPQKGKSNLTLCQNQLGWGNIGVGKLEQTFLLDRASLLWITNYTSLLTKLVYFELQTITVQLRNKLADKDDECYKQ